MPRPTLMLVLLLAALPALATGTAPQDPQLIARAVESFARTQTAGLPGEVSVAVGTVERRSTLPACQALEPFLPSGAKLWGSATVGVRCLAPLPWTLYVPVTVKVTGTYLVAGRALVHGQSVAEGDVELRTGDLTRLPAGALTDPAQLAGKTLVTGLAPGQLVRQDHLRAPVAVQQGQTVKLVAVGRGFRVSSEGRAVNNAQEGQLAQVRTSGGQVISGVARPGAVVEVAF